MADKYPTAELIGVVMTQSNSGAYEPKENLLRQNMHNMYNGPIHPDQIWLESGHYII